jgi:hypothetical protein
MATNTIADHVLRDAPLERSQWSKIECEKDWSRLITATVSAVRTSTESGPLTLEPLSPDVAWLVRDALEGPQLLGTAWDSPVLALNSLVSELN